MGWCALGLLGTGCDAKQAIKKVFNLDAISKNVFESSSKNSQKVNATSGAVASLEIEIENMNPGCPLNVAQSITAKTVSDATQVVENIATMTTDVTNDITNSADDALKSTSGFLSLKPGAKQDFSAELNKSITNIVERTFKMENLQQVSAASIKVAKGKISIVNCNAPIDIKQDIVASTISTAVMESLLDAFVNDATLNEVINKLDVEGEQEDSGIFESFGELFQRAFGGSAKWVWIGLSIALCILFIVIMRVALSPGGQQAMASAASSR